jgi:hypothetical protein
MLRAIEADRLQTKIAMTRMKDIAASKPNHERISLG